MGRVGIPCTRTQLLNSSNVRIPNQFLRCMATVSASRTAVILIDPYNDFLHPEGKLTSFLKDLQARDTIRNMKQLVTKARLHKIPIYYGLH